MSHSVRPRTSENRSQGVIVSISLKPGRPRSADSIIQDSSCSWSQSGHTGPLKLRPRRSCVSRGVREDSCVPALVHQASDSAPVQAHSCDCASHAMTSTWSGFAREPHTAVDAPGDILGVRNKCQAADQVLQQPCDWLVQVVMVGSTYC